MGMNGELFTIKKEDVVLWLFSLGMLVPYLGMLNPWFMWPLGYSYLIIAFVLLCGAMLVSMTMSKPLFTNRYYIPPTVAYAVIAIYQVVVSEGTIAGYVGVFFKVTVVMALLLMKREKLEAMMTFIAKFMGLLLLISIFGYVLYLLGFSLPYRGAEFEDGKYSFTNYYFFMIDDRTMTFIPRFSSVFLEPGHVGVAAVMVLMTQCGRWNRWYSIVMMVTALISFSLEAYVLLFLLVFFNLWLQKKDMLRKLVLAVALVAGIVAGSFVYNDGDNMLHELIVLRLEIEDGEMAGNNRVTDNFETEYANFLHSSDILFGRELTEGNNSGYKVYIYENGFVGLFLLFVFYILLLSRSTNKRALLAGVTIAFLDFIVRAHSLWFSIIIPLYYMAVGFHTDQPEVEDAPQKISTV